MKCCLIPRATDANVFLRMGSLSNAQYDSFHWYFKKCFVLRFFEEMLLSDLWITLKFYLKEAVGEHVIIFIYFPKEIVTQCILLRISHIHYRTMLGFIPFFPFCNLQTVFPLLIEIGFDCTWVMQWWNQRKPQVPFPTRAEATEIPARPQVPASRFSSCSFSKDFRPDLLYS